MTFHAEEASASVALIEWIDGNKSRVLVLQRALHPRDPWSGHLAFPGGRREPRDADLLQTCLREVQEECGFFLLEHELQRALPVASAGRTNKASVLVLPFYFQIRRCPRIELDSHEMQRYFWIDVGELRNRENHSRFLVRPGLEMPCFLVEGIPLWGFTYRVLLDWLDIGAPL